MMNLFIFVVLPIALIAFAAVNMGYIRSSENRLTRRFDDLRREVERVDERVNKHYKELIDHMHVVHGKEGREQRQYIEERVRQTNEYINAKASNADLHRVAEFATAINNEVQQLAQELGYHYIDEPARKYWRKKEGPEQ